MLKNAPTLAIWNVDTAENERRKEWCVPLYDSSAGGRAGRRRRGAGLVESQRDTPIGKLKQIKTKTRRKLKDI